MSGTAVQHSNNGWQYQKQKILTVRQVYTEDDDDGFISMTANWLDYKQWKKQTYKHTNAKIQT